MDLEREIVLVRLRDLLDVEEGGRVAEEVDDSEEVSDDDCVPDTDSVAVALPLGLVLPVLLSSSLNEADDDGPSTAGATGLTSGCGVAVVQSSDDDDSSPVPVGVTSSTSQTTPSSMTARGAAGAFAGQSIGTAAQIATTSSKPSWRAIVAPIQSRRAVQWEFAALESGVR